MEESKPNILVVDDEAFNLDILGEYLEDADYAPVKVENGLAAWSLLEQDQERFEAVLLDRMMPEMDGMELLTRVKAHPTLHTLPVIMQTAKAAKQDVLDGLQAGAYYYLTKPYDEAHMLAIVNTALADFRRYRSLREETRQTARTLSLMQKGRFRFRTLREGRNLAMLLANASHQAEKVVTGLSELMVNAVEHGNLGIGYEEKSRLNAQGSWEREVERRLALPENAEKQVVVSFERTHEGVQSLIQDQGAGFAWKEYLEFSPERLFDTHGRGIAMANSLSFDRLEYQGNGNRVVATIATKSEQLRGPDGPKERRSPALDS
ncbi:MAG: response regulator [Pseudomonadota bacterium]